MRAKKLFSFFLSVLLLAQCGMILPGAAADSGSTLYEQTAPATPAAIRKMWASNTPILSATMTTTDGSTRSAAAFACSQGGITPKGQSVTLQVADLALDTGAYGDIELTFRYAIDDRNCPPPFDALNDFRVYASTDGGATWSTDFVTMKRHDLVDYASFSETSTGPVYDVVTEDISSLVTEGQTINRLKIMPFGVFTQMWYMLYVPSITIKGYEGKSPVPAAAAAAPEYITMGEDTARQIVVEQAYRVLSFPWTTDALFVTDNHGTPLNHYPGWLYRGPVYVGKGTDASWEMYLAAHDSNGKYIKGLDSATAIGMQCINYTYSALSAVTPAKIHSLGVAKYFLPLLGGLTNKTRTHEAPVIIDENDEQAVYKAYAMAKPGDLIMNTGHARIVTVAPKVTYNADGTIDSERSAIGLSETAGGNQYFWLTSAGKSVVTTLSPDEYKEANPTHTYLYGTTMRVDLAYTFAQLYDTDYLPYTLPEYTRGQIAKQQLTMPVCSESGDLTANGFKAVVGSNYYIAQTTLTLTDKTSGKVVYTETCSEHESTDNNALVSSADLNAALKSLKTGSYQLTLDVRSGPITRILGKPPVTRMCTLDFTVN